MGKHPNHPQIAPELTAQPHTRAASTEGRASPAHPRPGAPTRKQVRGAKQSRMAEGPFPSPQHVWLRQGQVCSTSPAHPGHTQGTGNEGCPAPPSRETPAQSHPQPTEIPARATACTQTNQQRGGSSGKASGARWLFTLFVFLCDTPCGFATTSNSHISSSHILKIWAQPGT